MHFYLFSSPQYVEVKEEEEEEEEEEEKWEEEEKKEIDKGEQEKKKNNSPYLFKVRKTRKINKQTKQIEGKKLKEEK